MIKNYKQFIKESLLDELKGPSEEEVWNNLKELSDSDRIKTIIKLGNKEYYKYLPNNLTIEGNFYCGSKQLTSLPDNLTVNGSLDCTYNQLTSLPNNLTINGSLNCSYNQLTSLPDNLIVKGDLFCNENPLTYLSDNLIIGGDLYCYNNKIELKKPKNARIKGKIYN